MAELNELLEEAATEAGNLSGQADDTLDALGELVTRSAGLAQQVTSRADEIRHALEALRDALHQGEESVSAARGRAYSALEDLGARAGELRGEVTGVLDQVKHSLEGMETQKARLQADVDAHAQSVEGALHELSSHTSDAAEAVQHQLEDAMTAINHFRGAVHAARTELQAKRTEWEQAANGLEAQATEQALSWVDGVQHVLADQATAMVGMANELVETHNAVMDDLKDKYAVQAREAVATSLQTLADELTNLGHHAAEQQGALTAKSDEILGTVRRAVPLLEHLASQLDGAAGRIQR